MDTTLPSHGGREQEERPRSNMSEGLSPGAVQALRGEVAALRDVLSAMTVHAGLSQPAIPEELPGYEEASGGEFFLVSSHITCR